MKQRIATVMNWAGRVAIGLAGLYLVLLVISGAMLHSAYRALERAGRPMDPEAVRLPDVPDYENAAVLLQSAALRLMGEEIEIAYKGKPYAKSMLEGIQFLGSQRNHEQVLDLECDRQFRALLTHPITEESLVLVKEACSRPACRLASGADDGSSGQAYLEQLTNILRLSRILRGRAMVRAVDGDSVGSWDDISTVLQMAALLSEESSDIMTFLVRIAMTAICFSTMPDISVVGLPSEVQFQALDALLLKAQEIDFVRAIDRRRLLNEDSVFSHRRVERELPDSIPQPGRLLLERFWIKPLRQADHAAYLRSTLELVEHLQQPVAQGDEGRIDELHERMPAYAIMARLCMPSSSTIAQQVNSRAQCRVARGGLAVLMHHQVAGEYPEDLPLAGEQRLDPFNGEPLRYCLLDEGFMVYSVGPDLVDNSGTPYDSSSRTGDWVYKYPPDPSPDPSPSQSTPNDTHR